MFLYLCSMNKISLCGDLNTSLIVYATFFLTLGMALSFVHIPNKYKSENYRTSISMFGCAYLLLGLSAIFTPYLSSLSNWGKDYNRIYLSLMVSLTHAWLNAYAYLLILHPHKRDRRRFLRNAKWLYPATILMGALPASFPSWRGTVELTISILYMVQVAWMTLICLKKYRECVNVLQDYYSGTKGFQWIRNILIMIITLDIVNLINFHFPHFNCPEQAITLILYSYLAIRLLNYFPYYFYIEEARKAKAETEKLLAESEKDTGTEEKTAAAAGKQYEKVEPLITEWINNEGYCKSGITLTDAAYDMGTNRNYLSSYLNKHLGINFQNWLNSLRIERSKEYLSEYPEMTIDEIAHKVGFAQSYNFSRWFKQITSEPPIEWRKKRLQDYQDPPRK